MRTWKAIAESKDILENIKLEDFIYKIRDAFMRGEDKDEFTASQYDLINQLISDSESVHILWLIIYIYLKFPFYLYN